MSFVACCDPQRHNLRRWGWAELPLQEGVGDSPCVVALLTVLAAQWKHPCGKTLNPGTHRQLRVGRSCPFVMEYGAWQHNMM